MYHNLFSHSSVDGCLGLFPVLGYFELSCYEYSCASLYGYMLSFFLLKDLEVELLDHGAGVYFLKRLVSFHTPTSNESILVAF